MPIRKAFLLLTLTTLPLALTSPTKAEITGRICARSPGARVSLREGPGVNYPRGLVQANYGVSGQGRNRPVEDFARHGYTAQNGETVHHIFESTQGADGYTWHQVGTNLWVAWVRSDFICGSTL